FRAGTADPARHVAVPGLLRRHSHGRAAGPGRAARAAADPALCVAAAACPHLSAGGAATGASLAAPAAAPIGGSPVDAATAVTRISERHWPYVSPASPVTRRGVGPSSS